MIPIRPELFSHSPFKVRQVCGKRTLGRLQVAPDLPSISRGQRSAARRVTEAPIEDVQLGATCIGPGSINHVRNIWPPTRNLNSGVPPCA